MNLFYAAVSAGANNGSALGGFNADTPWANGILGAEMLLGRLIPLICTAALAQHFLQLKPAPNQASALSTASPLFIVLLLVIIVLVGALTLVPALALGPVALGL